MQKDLETISSLSKKTGPDLSFRLIDPPAILADLQTQMSGDFPVLSEASKKYEIRYVPAQLESTLSPAFYLTAPLDDPTRNVIYINNGSTSAKDELYPTLAHEAFPVISTRPSISGNTHTILWRPCSPVPGQMKDGQLM